MLLIILSLVAGIAVGYSVSLSEHQKKQLERFYTMLIFLLLFAMGLSLGNNQSLLVDLPRIGVYSLLFAIITILGSVLAVWLLQHSKVIRL